MVDPETYQQRTGIFAILIFAKAKKKLQRLITLLRGANCQASAHVIAQSLSTKTLIFDCQSIPYNS
jgi:hypothetical protein